MVVPSTSSLSSIRAIQVSTMLAKGSNPAYGQCKNSSLVEFISLVDGWLYRQGDKQSLDSQKLIVKNRMVEGDGVGITLHHFQTSRNYN